MIIDLKQLFEVEFDTLEKEYQLDLSKYELWGNFPFVLPIKVAASFENRAGVVSLTINISYEMELSCDRCLNNFDKVFNQKFEHNLVKSLNADSDDYIVVDNCKLDLDELIISDIILYLPSKLLCNNDCKGLCDKCGKNLNEGYCECKKDVGDPRFQILKDLLT